MSHIVDICIQATNHQQASLRSKELMARATACTRLKGQRTSRLNSSLPNFPNRTRGQASSSSSSLIMMKFLTLEMLARPWKLRTQASMSSHHLGHLFLNFAIPFGFFQCISLSFLFEIKVWPSYGMKAVILRGPVRPKKLVSYSMVQSWGEVLVSTLQFCLLLTGWSVSQQLNSVPKKLEVILATALCFLGWLRFLSDSLSYLEIILQPSSSLMTDMKLLRVEGSQKKYRVRALSSAFCLFTTHRNTFPSGTGFLQQNSPQSFIIRPKEIILLFSAEVPSYASSDSYYQPDSKDSLESNERTSSPFLSSDRVDVSFQVCFDRKSSSYYFGLGADGGANSSTYDSESSKSSKSGFLLGTKERCDIKSLALLLIDSPSSYLISSLCGSSSSEVSSNSTIMFLRLLRADFLDSDLSGAFQTQRIYSCS